MALKRKSMNEKQAQRMKRKVRIRTMIAGTSERPRLSVFRSGKHLYAQVIDDVTGHTLVAASTLGKELRAKVSELKGIDAAKEVGAAIAEACKAKQIDKVVFDRNGFLYHGRVKSLAEAAREKGLSF